jgi:hypothetical protein
MTIILEDDMITAVIEQAVVDEYPTISHQSVQSTAIHRTILRINTAIFAC